MNKRLKEFQCMKSVIHSSLIAVENPEDYEARSNIMWTATWALNTLISRGKSTDWMVHMIGQSVGAYTDATHGMTLAVVSLPYYRMIMPYGLKKFKRFAEEVWGISSEGKISELVSACCLCYFSDIFISPGYEINLLFSDALSPYT